MKNLRSILCEIAFYVTAVSPALVGGAVTGALAGVSYKKGIELEDANYNISVLLKEVSETEEFKKAKDDRLSELLELNLAGKITDDELREKSSVVYSDEFVIEYVEKNLPPIFEEYNKLYNNSKECEEYKSSTIIAAYSVLAAASLSQIGMIVSGATSKLIKKGAKLRKARKIEKLRADLQESSENLINYIEERREQREENSGENEK